MMKKFNNWVNEENTQNEKTQDEIIQRENTNVQKNEKTQEETKEKPIVKQQSDIINVQKNKNTQEETKEKPTENNLKKEKITISNAINNMVKTISIIIGNKKSQ